MPQESRYRCSESISEGRRRGTRRQSRRQQGHQWNPLNHLCDSSPESRLKSIISICCVFERLLCGLGTLYHSLIANMHVATLVQHEDSINCAIHVLLCSLTDSCSFSALQRSLGVWNRGSHSMHCRKPVQTQYRPALRAEFAFAAPVNKLVTCCCC